MDVFEVGDLPLRMVTSLYGWKTSLLGGEFSLGGVTPPWGWTGLPKKVGHHLRERSFQTKRVVNDFKNLYENVKSYFDSISVFVKYFDQNII